jgi:indolepyruvate ferredoxin oxidoreductase
MLMSPKDEYEVARLYADPEFEAAVARRFVGDYALRLNLAPPWLSRRGVSNERPKKWSFGAWILPFLKLLSLGRHVRGTLVDPLRSMPERKLDRRLLATFEALFERAEREATAGSIDAWSGLLERAQDVKGFEQVRRARAEPVLAAWDAALRPSAE